MLLLSACGGGTGGDGGPTPPPASVDAGGTGGQDAGTGRDAGSTTPTDAGSNPGDGTDAGSNPGGDTDAGSGTGGTDAGSGTGGDTDAGSGSGGTDAGSAIDAGSPAVLVMPELLHITPAGPANDNAPVVTGRGTPGSTVRLYSGANCTGIALGSTTVGGTGSFSAAITVADNTDTPVRATASDALGGLTPCSTTSLRYLEDSQAPLAPVLSRTEPTSPASDPTPNLVGTAEAGSRVRIYTTAACSGTPVAEGLAEGGAFTLTVSVPMGSTTDFRATATDVAGNTSPCSSPRTYRQENVIPPPPTFSRLEPSAASVNNNQPRLFGQTLEGFTGRIYGTDHCTGTALAHTQADATGAFAVTVSVADNTSTTFRATTMDPYGNTSPCSDSTLSYVEDSQAPAPPKLSLDYPVSSVNDPYVYGTTESHALVSIFTNASCSGTPIATGRVGGFASRAEVVVPPVPDNSTTTFYGTATDAAGNTSGCSAGVVYTEDSTPPPAPTLLGTSPASPAKATTFSLSGTTEPNAWVYIRTSDQDCALSTSSVRADASGDFSVEFTVPANSNTRYYVVAADPYGNRSQCYSAPFEYASDTVAPFGEAQSVKDGLTGDSVWSTERTSASANWQAFYDLNGIARYEHQLSTSSLCTGDVRAATDAGTATSHTLTGLTLAEQQLYYHCVRAIDRAGNVSRWMGSNGFRVDSVKPRVSTQTPAPNAVDVDIWAGVTVRFSEDVDAATVTADTFQVLLAGQPVPGAFDCDRNTCTFWSDDAYPHLSAVSVLLTPGLKDVAGNGLGANVAWSFKVRDLGWSTPVIPSANRPYHVQVGIAGSGIIHAVWREFPSSLWTKAYTPGFGWGAPRKIADTSTAGPLLGVSESGHAIIAWTESLSTRTYVKAITSLPGEGWSAATDLGNSADMMRDLALAINAAGEAHVAWATPYSVAARSWSPSTKWESLKYLGSAGVTSTKGLTVAAGAEGRAVAVWVRGIPSTGALALAYATHAAGSGWGDALPGPSVDEGTSYLYPRLALNAEGSGVLAWASAVTMNGVSRKILYGSSYTGAGGFSAPQTLQNLPSAALQENSARVAVNSQGHAVVTWTQVPVDAVERYLWTARYVSGTGWQTSQSLATAVIDSDVAMDPAGNAIVLYNRYEGSLARMWTRTHDASGWGAAVAVEKTAAERPQHDPQLKINGKGHRVATWENMTNSILTSWISHFD
jgi:hypothetical protein